jgi:hypothetical protein
MYSAHPEIFVDGQQQPALSESLLALAVEETVEGMCACEATFANWGAKNGSVGYLYNDREILDFGKTIKVGIGAGQGAGTVFEGRIMGLEGRYFRERAPEILVLAEDRLQDLRMTRRTRAFEQLSDSDLFQQVASQHGLQAQADVSGPTHRVLAQLNQSDLAFMRERARAVDAELWLEGSTLHVQARSRRQGGNVKLSYGSGLLEFSALADLSRQVSGFAVSGWDTSGKQAIQYRATDAAISGELANDQGGSSLLGQAIGQRDQQVVHSLPFTSQEAQALAEAQFRRAARRFVVGRGVAQGDARVRPGASVELKGLGRMFDGKYYVVEVRHTFDTAHGLRTHFTAERPGIGR